MACGGKSSDVTNHGDFVAGKRGTPDIVLFSLTFFFVCFNQAKLRLEMAAEHDKHVAQKEMESKDEEIEQLRSNMQKKV